MVQEEKIKRLEDRIKMKAIREKERIEEEIRLKQEAEEMERVRIEREQREEEELTRFKERYQRLKQKKLEMGERAKQFWLAKEAKQKKDVEWMKKK